MVEIKAVKIFIASSIELSNERKLCIQIITQLNESHRHLHLKPVEWEISLVHSNYPQSETIQDAINPKLKESDLIVFIFYSKIGKYTREEFEFSNKENKKLFAFFKTGFSPDIDGLETYGELLKFKNSLDDTVLYKEYDDLDDFEKLFYPNLNLYLAENHPLILNESETESVKALSQSNLQLIQLLTSKEEEIKTLKENSRHLTDKDLQIQISILLQEKEEIKNELKQSEEIKKQLAKDKADLEKQLAPQIESNNLKAKALEELENENYAEAEKYLLQSAESSVTETAATFFELAKIKKLQLKYFEASHFFQLAAKIATNDSLYLNEAGTMLAELGFYREALENYEKALEIDEKIHGSEHWKIGIRYNNIGGIYLNGGDYNKAIAFFEKAIEINKKTLGEKHHEIATCYNNIGLAYNSKADYYKAIEYYEIAIKIDQKIFGNYHQNIATYFSNMGLAFHYLAENDRAIEYYEISLKIGQKIFGNEHPSFAIRLSNIGIAYTHKAEFDKALLYFEKALTIDKKFFGDEHPAIATGYSNIGLVHMYKQEFNKAIQYYEKTLSLDKKFLGDEHPDIAISYTNIGRAYGSNGEYDKAIQFCKNALTMLLKFLPENHPSIQTAKFNIAEMVEGQKRTTKT